MAGTPSAAKKPTAQPASQAQKKSGMRTFKPGEVVFRENDPAESLYIIQKGQIRLYRPKGRGFVDLAILRSGEVIGEMAYFDEKARRRSCSAEAMVTTEVIEISFVAFEKTIQNLNPWFKTIINTLADRLRKTNEKVKALESNSIGFGQGGKVADYKFFHNIDIVRLLSMFYLVTKSVGEQKDGKHQIHMNTLKTFILDIFNIQEVKYEEFLNLLVDNKFVALANDETGFPKIIQIANLEQFNTIMNFINSQRILEDTKKLKISGNCEIFISRIIQQLSNQGEAKDRMVADISLILADFEKQKIIITDKDLDEAVAAGLCEDIIVGSGNRCTSVVNFNKMRKLYPCIRFMNLITKINDLKASAQR